MKLIVGSIELEYMPIQALGQAVTYIAAGAKAHMNITGAENSHGHIEYALSEEELSEFNSFCSRLESKIAGQLADGLRPT